MRPFMRHTALVLAFLACGAGCTPDDAPPPAGKPALAPPAADSPPDVTSEFIVTQEIAPNYTPRAPFIVKATMNYTGSAPVTALALRTVLPQAWVYAGITGELRPAIDPPSGTTAELTMIWIQIPSFPATVEYALDVPDWAEGTCSLSAQAIYRTLGGELKSPANEETATSAK